MKRNKTILRNWPRYLIQWGTLGVLVFFLSGLAGLFSLGITPAKPKTYCPMSGLEAFSTYLSNGTIPDSMATTQIFAGLVLALAVMFIGKLFCGYLCPVGTVQDLVSKLRNLAHIKSISIYEGSFFDKVLRIVKYVLLFWVFYMSARGGELFSKRLDPYYAVATGFKGDIALGLSITTVLIVVLGGLIIDSFWCRYVCPLGAMSNTLKFWPWVLGITAFWYVLNLLGVHISWTTHLAILFLMGYVLEILHGKPKCQVLSMVRNPRACNRCGACTAACPYRIDIRSFEDKIYSVDCTLCGDCAAACKKNALNIGFSKKEKSFIWKLLPAVFAVCMAVIAVRLGNRHELPAINQIWGIEDYDADSVKVRVVDPTTLRAFAIDGLQSIKNIESSIDFKARLEQVPGIHGVKTYTGSQRVVITYDPAVTDSVLIKKAVFIPMKIKIKNPDPQSVDSIRIYTVRTERMYDPQDLKTLSWTFGAMEKDVYALESEFASPLVVRVYMNPKEAVDSSWFKDTVEWNSEIEFKYLEGKTVNISTADFLHRMFEPFHEEYYATGQDGTSSEKRTELYARKKQYVYEIADANLESPSLLHALSKLGSHISKEDGVISMSFELNEELIPALKIRYSYPMTSTKLKELLNADKWSGTGEIVDEHIRNCFKQKGKVYPYSNK